MTEFSLQIDTRTSEALRICSFVLNPIMLVTGIYGDIVAFSIFNEKKMRTMYFSTCMKFVAVISAAFLLNASAALLLNDLYPLKKRAFPNFQCRMFTFIDQATFLACGLIIFLLSLSRSYVSKHIQAAGVLKTYATLICWVAAILTGVASSYIFKCYDMFYVNQGFWLFRIWHQNLWNNSYFKE
ncbi:hypothetical protein ACOME3_009075 [Neoechinorhynchus agilis]